jgi:hypothetical protein
LKDAEGVPYFALGANFLSPEAPKVGHQAQFTILPPAVGHKLKRATEIKVLAASARRMPEQIVLLRDVDGVTRIALRTKRGSKSRDKILDEIFID